MLDKSEEILLLLRKITRSIDLYSKQLEKRYGLTGPQMVVLKIIVQQKSIYGNTLAQTANLSPATITSILDRLEKKGYSKRERTDKDKRKVVITATQQANELFADSPAILQEKFTENFESLKNWEQSLLISSLERIADMMSAENVDASPYLTTSSNI